MVNSGCAKESHMKIQRLTEEHRAKAYALLRGAFPGSEYEARLVQLLHEKQKPIHEWVCIHTGKAIAYIAFSNAFNGRNICGLHLAPMAVAPEFQRQGVGTELMRFALRQDSIKSQPLFVLGAPAYYRKFGFEPCSVPICPYDKNNAHFLSLRHDGSSFTIGYEPEFKAAAKQSRQPEESRPAKPRVTKRR
jgi:putative acetyltransferase